MKHQKYHDFSLEIKRFMYTTNLEYAWEMIKLCKVWVYIGLNNIKLWFVLLTLALSKLLKEYFLYSLNLFSKNYKIAFLHTWIYIKWARLMFSHWFAKHLIKHMK